MWMKFFISFQSWNGLSDNFLNILQLITISSRIEEKSSMRKAVHLFESNIERSYVVKSGLKDIVCILELRSVNEWKTKVNVRLPPRISRIIFLTKSLNLFIVVLDCKSQSSMMNQFNVIEICLHLRYVIKFS